MSTDKGTWIEFVLFPKEKGKKPDVWSILTKGDVSKYLLLGHIRWYGPWRKYTFWPLSQTVFEETCLREIAAFVETKTKEHRAANKLKRAAKSPE